MTYEKKIQDLVRDNFRRVERDDRLLDIFSLETREKGIELWEKWNKETVEIVRFHLPYSPQREKHFSLDRKNIETLLYTNQKSLL